MAAQIDFGDLGQTFVLPVTDVSAQFENIYNNQDYLLVCSQDIYLVKGPGPATLTDALLLAGTYAHIHLDGPQRYEGIITQPDGSFLNAILASGGTDANLYIIQTS